MTEKIKIALLHWARKVIDQSAGWDEEKTHDAIQKLYELSIVQKMLLEQENPDQNLWKQQQAQLSEVIESLTGKSSNERPKEENMEVAPMMETIKNMVIEMPEPETYEKLFETVEETPTFVPKANEAVKKQPETKVSQTEERKNLNDQFAKTLSIDLNDRLAFVKRLGCVYEFATLRGPAVGSRNHYLSINHLLGEKWIQQRRRKIIWQPTILQPFML